MRHDHHDAFRHVKVIPHPETSSLFSEILP
jgi:hypothetical protein